MADDFEEHDFGFGEYDAAYDGDQANMDAQGQQEQQEEQQAEQQAEPQEQQLKHEPGKGRQGAAPARAKPTGKLTGKRPGASAQSKSHTTMQIRRASPQAVV